MRLIDADAITSRIKHIIEAERQIFKKASWNFAEKCLTVVESAPTVDAVEVVQCKYCKYSIDFYDEGDCYCRRPDRGLEWVGDWDFYCKAAERRQDG